MKEKIFPSVKKAWEDYKQSGIVRSVYSSCFAIHEDKIKQISQSPSIEIILREKVNPVKLQAAVNKAVVVCPYAAFDISKKNGVPYFYIAVF